MKLYAFSDFHLSGDPPTKPMDIFGPAWNNHREKIINAWMETIHPEDTVIMAGDLSWAMHIQDAISDLKMLGTLPGRKSSSAATMTTGGILSQNDPHDRRRF